MPHLSSDDISKTVENTLYTAVGLGILGFQHLQVQRQQLKRALREVFAGGSGAPGGDAADAPDATTS